MKFQVKGRVGVIKGDQVSAHECYALATKSDQKAKAILIIYQINDIGPPDREVTKMLSDLDPNENNEQRARLVEDLQEVVLDTY